MSEHITGQYTSQNTFTPDMSAISSDYWTSLNTAITAEVSRSFPTMSDLTDHYHAQLIGLWLVAFSSAITFAVVKMLGA